MADARLIRAIDLLEANDWPGAHALVQDLDGPIACRIHGLVHRMEGDLANSRYWYQRAGVAFEEARRVEDEIRELRDLLSASS